MKHWADKYDKIEQIGQGASGKIFKIMRKDNKQIMAAKVIIIDKEKDELLTIKSEESLNIKMDESLNIKSEESLKMEEQGDVIWGKMLLKETVSEYF